jgi:hypothetical protein
VRGDEFVELVDRRMPTGELWSFLLSCHLESLCQ